MCFLSYPHVVLLLCVQTFDVTLEIVKSVVSYPNLILLMCVLKRYTHRDTFVFQVFNKIISEAPIVSLMLVFPLVDTIGKRGISC